MFSRVVFSFHYTFKLGFSKDFVLVSLLLYVLDSLNQGCKPWLSRIRFHASFVGKTASKITLLPFRCALSFHLSKSRSCVQSFDSFQANKIQLHVANLGHARPCGSLGKERNYFRTTLEKSVQKTKLRN